MAIEKPVRIKDRKLLDTYHKKRCVACGKTPSDPAHIISRGAGGDDVDWNLIALCRKHHSMSHALGWFKFCQLFPFVGRALKIKGWVFGERNNLERAS